jgi:hypothetical protein
MLIPSASAQGTQTSGGVDVPGSWYVGEGLEKGNYFEYRLCELDLNSCAPILMKIWIKGDITQGSETLWDAQVVVIDGNKIVKGNMALGKVAAEPVIQSENLFHYSRAFKSSVAWLSAFATADTSDFIHGPKKFQDKAWGKIGAIGGAQLIPLRAEKISVLGHTEDTVVVGWYSGDNNEIYILDDFPFPVKALTYAWVTTGVAPVMYQFEIQKYEKNVTSDPFVDVVSTENKASLLGCPTDFFKYITATKSTNTGKMLVEYSYSPENPMAGCDIDWKINFKNQFNEVQFVDQVHYDIWVVDDKGNKLRSFAQETGRADLFNGFGQVHIKIPVKENPGLNKYAIFVYGVGNQYDSPKGDLAGYVIVDINIAENKNMPSNGNNNVTPSITIPSWIKTNAGWWANDEIQDSDFVQGIQYLITNGIMKIPSTTPGSSSGSNDIPIWIKNNAGWWSKGQISDNDFVQGIQYLIKNGIMKIA